MEPMAAAMSPEVQFYEPVFDCEGNTLFIGSNDDNHKGYISVYCTSLNYAVR